MPPPRCRAVESNHGWQFPSALRLLVVGLVCLAVGFGLWAASPKDKPLPPGPVTLTQPLTLTIPNMYPDGSAKPVPRYQAAPETTAKVLDVPIVASVCAIERDGSIGAPNDYTKACIYNHALGGQAILSHSVRGGGDGVFDGLADMKPGQKVFFNGLYRTVESVDIYPADALPNDLWTEGQLSLISCTVTPAHKTNPAEPWTHTTVVRLTL